MNKNFIIKSKRLLLEPLSDKHVDQLFTNWGSDPKVFISLSSNSIDSIEKVHNVIEKSFHARDKDIFYRYTLIEKSSGQAIGLMTLTPKSDEQYEMGYSIGSKFWGKGYATEAIMFASLYLKNFLKIKDVVATVRSDNIASVRALEKNQFKIVSKQPRKEIYGEDCHDPDAECIYLEKKLSVQLEHSEELAI